MLSQQKEERVSCIVPCLNAGVDGTGVGLAVCSSRKRLVSRIDGLGRGRRKRMGLEIADGYPSRCVEANQRHKLHRPVAVGPERSNNESEMTLKGLNDGQSPTRATTSRELPSQELGGGSLGTTATLLVRGRQFHFDFKVLHTYSQDCGLIGQRVADGNIRLPEGISSGGVFLEPGLPQSQAQEAACAAHLFGDGHIRKTRIETGKREGKNGIKLGDRTSQEVVTEVREPRSRWGGITDSPPKGLSKQASLDCQYK
ncbi:hypothetical protein LX32DRAFT_269728 [Colletotrichum zoysiae]|uniref:Uncharacterized protein n=1 Tax=Colletotrichum zoysiae TaxID=1216348 RepID=A0AAD9H3K4_9PEZI|nr:hypothetical protein LX32DRAFT_269728 [Colletotrichum zoysiae]